LSHYGLYKMNVTNFRMIINEEKVHRAKGQGAKGIEHRA